MMHRRSDPFDELFDVFREFDSLFRRTWGGLHVVSNRGEKALPGAGAGQSLEPSPGSWLSSWRDGFQPAVDCLSKGGSLILRMELPGVDPSEVEVNLVGSRLTIRGEKREQRESEEGGVFLKESAHGKFERSFTLPEGVQADQVKARYSNGVLEVTLPAPEQAARKLTIEVAGEPGRKAIKAAS